MNDQDNKIRPWTIKITKYVRERSLNGYFIVKIFCAITYIWFPSWIIRGIWKKWITASMAVCDKRFPTLSKFAIPLLKLNGRSLICVPQKFKKKWKRWGCRKWSHVTLLMYLKNCIYECQSLSKVVKKILFLFLLLVIWKINTTVLAVSILW